MSLVHSLYSWTGEIDEERAFGVQAYDWYCSWVGHGLSRVDEHFPALCTGQGMYMHESVFVP